MLMPNVTCRAFVFMFLLAMIGGCSSRPAQNDDVGEAVAVPIIEQIHGDISGVDEPGVFLIRSEQELLSYGSATLAALKVDFNERALLLLSLGQQPTGGYWARISEVVQHGHTLVVIGQANRPAPADVVPQVVTTPFCVAIIPITDATRVRSDVLSTTGQPQPVE